MMPPPRTTGLFGSVLVAMVLILVPVPTQASCSGLAGEAYSECLQAESEMIKRYQEDAVAARLRILFVESGDERLKTTEYELLYSEPNECKFLKREGHFRVVDESGHLLIEGTCACCTHTQEPATEKRWNLHGSYRRYNDASPNIENHYWCGVETQWLNDLHRKSITEGCE